MHMPRKFVRAKALTIAALISLGVGPLGSRPCFAYPPSTTQSVDASGDVGQSTSIKVDAAGNPHISYYDADHGDLKYAHKSGGVWVPEPADASTDDVGKYTSLVLDASGNPHIS